MEWEWGCGDRVRGQLVAEGWGVTAERQRNQEGWGEGDALCRLGRQGGLLSTCTAGQRMAAAAPVELSEPIRRMD